MCVNINKMWFRMLITYTCNVKPSVILSITTSIVYQTKTSVESGRKKVFVDVFTSLELTNGSYPRSLW